MAVRIVLIPPGYNSQNCRKATLLLPTFINILTVATSPTFLNILTVVTSPIFIP